MKMKNKAFMCATLGIALCAPLAIETVLTTNQTIVEASEMPETEFGQYSSDIVLGSEHASTVSVTYPKTMIAGQTYPVKIKFDNLLKGGAAANWVKKITFSGLDEDQYAVEVTSPLQYLPGKIGPSYISGMTVYGTTDQTPDTTEYAFNITPKVTGSLNMTGDFSYSFYDSIIQDEFPVKEPLNVTMDITGNDVIDKTEISVKDTTISYGSTWDKEDNFISAMDKDGNPLTINDLEVTGGVDTTKPGKYEVTYTFGTVSKVATITVSSKDELPVITTKPVTLFVGDKWSPYDGVVSAKTKDGKDIDLMDIMVSGEVNTQKPGKYTVEYTYQGVTEKSIVTVNESKATLLVKDSTIKINSKWEAKDNFVSATDVTGKEISFEDVVVSGEVNTKKEGVYTVKYMTKVDGRERVADAKITVSADAPDHSKENENNNGSNNSMNKDGKTNSATGKNTSTASKKGLPTTGEKVSITALVTGSIAAIASGIVYFVKNKKKAKNR